MENKYTFGRDTYVYDDTCGVKMTQYTPLAPPQQQDQVVGLEYVMKPLPIFDDPNYLGSGKLKKEKWLLLLEETLV